MKIAALLSGILASTIAWAASYFVKDLSIDFLNLWPVTPSQQLIGIIVWHAIIALPLVGGAIAVFAPISGGILLLAGAGTWVWLGLTLPNGFSPQLVVPLAFAAIGAAAAFGARVRGAFRRRAVRQQAIDADEFEREEALRLEPNEDLARAVDARARSQERAATPPSEAVDDAIVPVATGRRRDEPPQGLGGLVIVNALLLLILTIAVGVLLYSDFRSGSLTSAFSTLPFASEGEAPQVSEATGPAPAPAPAAASEAPTLVAASVETPETTGATEAPETTGATEIPETTGATEAEVRVSSIPLDLAALPVDSWSDPFAYCAAVGTIDFPDHRYTGPLVTEAIATALHVPATSPPDRVKWRCVEGTLLACAAFRMTPSCAPTPTVPEMIAYCAENPNALDLAAPNGTWFCEDTEPQIPRGETWPVDARGFLPGAWVAIAPPAPTSG